MNSRLCGFALVMLAVCVAIRGAEPKPSPTAATTQRVVKLIATSGDERLPFGGGRGMGRGAGGGPGRNNNQAANNQPAVPYLIVTAPEGGLPVKLLVTDDFKRKLPGLGGERGELITVTVKTGSLGTEMVTAAVAFDGPKTLKNPHVYIYDGLVQQKVGVQTYTAARLSKFGQTREVLIANRASFEGAKPQPDQAMIERLNAITVGDVVEVELAAAPGRNAFYLIDVDAPYEAMVGTFLKMTSLKDSANKTVSGIVIEAEGKEKSYLLPAQIPAAVSNVWATAIVNTAKSLRPGQGVKFGVKQAEGALVSIRSLSLDGAVELTGEKTINVVSTYVRVDFSENFFGRDREPNVDYRPGSQRHEDHLLERGAAKVLESDAEAERIKLTPDQSKQLSAALDMKVGRDGKASAAEKNQWLAAYNAWFSARDDAARANIELEMLRAGQDLSMRWKKEVETKFNLIRTIFTPEQLEEVKKLGERNRAVPAALGA